MYNLLLSLETAKLQQYVADNAEKPDWRKIEKLVEKVHLASMDVILSIARNLHPTKTELLEVQTLQKECALIIDAIVNGANLENIEHTSAISMYAQDIRNRAQEIEEMRQMVQQRKEELISEEAKPRQLHRILRTVTGVA